MSVVDPRQAASVLYPETDGQPMGETDLHIHWMIRIRDLLKFRYRDTRTYVAANLLVYYDEGIPRHFIVPDVFVVLNCDPGFRRIYKTWEEGVPPQVVFEVTSVSTRREDQAWKPQRYAEIGVQEYFLYDPSAEYLVPPLQGFRLANDRYQPIQPDNNGRLASQVLGILLELDGKDLALRDAATAGRLLTGQEAAEQQAQAAEQHARTAEQQARTAEQRNAELEAELRRLRDRLGE